MLAAPSLLLLHLLLLLLAVLLRTLLGVALLLLRRVVVGLHGSWGGEEVVGVGDHLNVRLSESVASVYVRVI